MDKKMDKEIIKISLLIPIYMVEKYIEKCLQSVFEQTYLNIEYVFINDCTQDKSMDILKNIILKYPHRKEQIKIINNTKNEGIAKARNQCLKHATGDYILFIDSDDWIEKNMVEIMANKAKETNADIIGCGYYEEYSNNRIPFKQTYPSDHLNAMKAITLLTIKGVLWKLLVKKRLYTDNNIQFVPDIQIGEDYIVCCKLFFYSKNIRC